MERLLKRILSVILCLAACASFISPPKGAIAYQQDNLTQANLDGLTDCAKKYYNPLNIEGVTVEGNNKMQYMGLTDTPDHIFVRTRDNKDNLLSAHTIDMIILHEFCHTTRWRGGFGPDSNHIYCTNERLDPLEQKTTQCNEAK